MWSDLLLYAKQVREVLSAPDFTNKVLSGARYRLTGEVNAFNFTVDAHNRVYIVISALDYPTRLVFSMINALVIRFRSEFETQSLSCVSGALNTSARKLFQTLIGEYDDPTKLDKLSIVQDQVYDVTRSIAKNVDGLLRNIDKASDIERTSISLGHSAEMWGGIFFTTLIDLEFFQY